MTLDQLKELVSYSELTGEFRRVNSVVDKAVGSPDKDGYLLIKVSGKTFRSHRLAWFYVHGRWPAQDIDHINGIKNDNRLSNLREATRSQNKANIGVPGNSTSGIKGVCWNKALGKWQAHIKVKGKMRHLGFYPDKEDARYAYAIAAKDLFGEFARS